MWLLVITLVLASAEHVHHQHSKPRIGALDYGSPFEVNEIDITPEDGVKFVSGLLEGILQEDCSAIENCVSLSEGAVKDIEEAIHQF